MKKLIVFAIALGGISASAQNSTTTCTNYIPNQVTCQTTNGDGNVFRQKEEDRGRAIGESASLGAQIAGGLMLRHKINSLKHEQCRARGAGSQWGVINNFTGQVIAGGFCSDKDAR